MVRHTETAEAIVSYANRHGIDILSDRFEFDRHPEDLPSMIHLLTATDADGGELVIVKGSRHGDDGNWYVTLRFPERDAPDGDDYTYETSVDSFFARVEADGGWVEVPPSVRKDDTTANCPSCGGFMTIHDGRTGFDGDGDAPFAWAGCRCGKHVDHDFLVDEGVVVELLL